MDQRLHKQWEVTRGWLEAAASEITSAVHREEFGHFINHNELELALDVLEDAASHRTMSAEFWWRMKKSAEVMGAHRSSKAFQRKYQEVGVRHAANNTLVSTRNGEAPLLVAQRRRWAAL